MARRRLQDSVSGNRRKGYQTHTSLVRDRLDERTRSKLERLRGGPERKNNTKEG